MNRTPNPSYYLHKPDEQEEQPAITKPQSLVANEQPLSENAPHKLRTPIEARQPGGDRNDGCRFIAKTENAMVIEENGRFHLKIGSQSLSDYTEFNISTNR